LKVSCDGQALGHCLRYEPARGKRLRRPCSRSDGPLPRACKLKDGSETPFGLADAFTPATGPARVGDLLPDARRLGQFAGELCAQTQTLERHEPPCLVLSLRPELEGAPSNARGVTVRVDRAERFSGREQRRTRAFRLLRRKPVLTD
jgi:hypothetical protein